MKFYLWIGFALLCTGLGVLGLLNSADAQPLRQEALHRPAIYAYRDWQSLGILVKPGDRVEINASGAWYYTPRDYHGPEGHPLYLSPDFYPLPGVSGGALIGRIGEEGVPFYVGTHTVIDGSGSEYSSLSSRAVAESGLLYLRIDDDILSDNAGAIQVEVAVTPQAE